MTRIANATTELEEEIEITPAMIEAGVAAMEADLCEDVSFWRDRPESVAQIYRVMHMVATTRKAIT